MQEELISYVDAAPSPISKSEPAQIFLKEVLDEIEEIFEVYFVYESNLIVDQRIPPYKNRRRKGLEYNLRKVLRHTGLEFVKVAETTFVIVKTDKKGILQGKVLERNKQVLTGATIRVQGKDEGVVSDLDGNYKLELPAGQHQLEISYVGYKPILQTVFIPPSDSLHLNIELADCSSLEEVVVLGARFQETSLLTKTEPADVVTHERLSNTAQMEIAQLLQYTVPSFHSTHQTISDGTDHIDPATLRGLGPDQMLVLINGKRRHHSALVNINGTVGRGSVSTDLNAIPAAAIERIEILKDGAATEYGSDAIAGVINLVLKEKTYFTNLNIFSGISQQGDGAGFQVNGNHGLALGDRGGFLNLTVDFSKRNRINRSGAYTGKVFGDERDKDEEQLKAFFDQTGYGDRRVMSIGSAAATNAALFLNAEWPLGKKAKAYAFGGGNYRLGESGGFYRFPYQEARQSGFYPMGFSPILNTHIFDKSMTVGVSSHKTPLQIDFSNTIGGNHFDFNVKNSNNASMGLYSPTEAYAGGFSYTQNVTNLDISKKLDTRIPLHLRGGTEFRLENYRQRAGEEASWVLGTAQTVGGTPKEAGFQMFPGFRPENEIDAYRHNLGVYANLRADLLKSATLSGGLRYEYYSDFGSRLTWKIGGRYTFNDLFTIRGNCSTGFRAPSMPQVHFSSHGFQFIARGGEVVGTEIAHFNNQSPISKQFGMMPLQAETSKNYSLGVVSQLSKNLSLTIDAYDILIHNRIVITGRFSADQDIRFAEILDPSGISQAQFFTNSIDTKTRGLDASLNYDLNFESAALYFSLATNISRHRLRRDAEGQAIIHAAELLQDFKHILFNREEISRIEVAQPSNKTILTTRFKSGKLDLMLNFTRFGAVQYINPEDGDPARWVRNEYNGVVESRDQTFAPKWITDLSAKYQFTPRLALDLGGNNILNVYPDRHHHAANTNHGRFIYSRRVQQFGVRGAFWYGRMNFRF